MTNVAENFSLSEKIKSLDGDELAGFVAGVKGKMFEQQYVEYLNEGNLPDGYTAVLASSPNQPDWDIRIDGPNGELVEIMQAKATDSMGYIADALKNNPAIDVVTTEEVYSHLVMSGVSEGIVNSEITNDSLEAALDSAIESSDVNMNWSPPWFTLGLIAFTSYKDESLTLFEKARSAGDRSGKAYLCYLVGGVVTTATNTWWLGVVGTVASRYLVDAGRRKRAVFDQFLKVAAQNDRILENWQPVPYTADEKYLRITGRDRTIGGAGKKFVA